MTAALDINVVVPAKPTSKPLLVTINGSERGSIGVTEDIRVAVFDLDGTLLLGTTAAREISRAAGVLKEIVELEDQFMLGCVSSLDFSSRALELWGADLDAVFDLAYSAAPRIGNLDLAISKLRSAGVVTVLMSMAPLEFVRRFDQFDFVFGSTYGTSILDAEAKLAALEKLLCDLGCKFRQVCAFGDSFSDIAIFRSVPFSVAVNAKDDLLPFARWSYRGNDLLEALRVVVGDSACAR